MSTDPTADKLSDPDLPTIDHDAITTGAAADSSEADDRLKNLPRVLRYAMLVSTAAKHIDQRLAAEITELCPDLALTTGWLAGRETESGQDLVTDLGLLLASELDRLAVNEDRTDLRSLADCVRLLSLPVPTDICHFGEHRRVAKSLLIAFVGFARSSDDEELCSDLERFCFGWVALPTCGLLLSRYDRSAAYTADIVGARMAEHRVEAAKASVWKLVEDKAKQKEEKQAEQRKKANDVESQTAAPRVAVPEDRLVVARLTDEEMKNIKLKDIIGPLKSVINVTLPLVQSPPLHEVRELLMFEFPYAADVIDFVLADLVGRVTVRLRPLLLVGDPGGGKSRFSRRLGEVLGLNVWRTDASRSDGAVFAGTDRRWYSAEPCHPFLAIGRAKHANPLVLLDEIEKAGTRTDYGRLWDCLLGFLEPETNARYPDPALQITLDLSQVSYIATANSLDPLPSPIRDRFRVITFPKPTANDLDALLPAVTADLVGERGLDSRWVAPLDGTERMAVATHWRGGSVRRLRRLVEAILRERDLRAARN
ncbi:ATPase associated with various cellular activities, AAA_5 [Nitrobacter hamburgensis X14]|uniref:ATPase associated with various cellular activities, AAA_5 n=1 Tax=Nitrobacter hamburgensis (strain DSM 10229 / NCIMB 13809 / X14) TaxID=323097 RepID=Q1QGZ6_NITHX|nr:AAA family ATPase [Nitrobacter hamburgensis]ABE64501.1 ATPase associated with various cellular activities, AAA_5 [Nitrobacter hamburgensis X14]